MTGTLTAICSFSRCMWVCYIKNILRPLGLRCSKKRTQQQHQSMQQIVLASVFDFLVSDPEVYSQLHWIHVFSLSIRRYRLHWPSPLIQYRMAANPRRSDHKMAFTPHGVPACTHTISNLGTKSPDPLWIQKNESQWKATALSRKLYS